ncbi:MAG: hypothetical protein Q9174_002494 [Haloplaca sp. 1 TL-2023]
MNSIHFEYKIFSSNAGRETENIFASFANTMVSSAAAKTSSHTSISSNTSIKDIDLDSIFDGQGATDLVDDNDLSEFTLSDHESSKATEKEDPLFAHARFLLDQKRTGLSLSGAIPDSQEADEALRLVLQSKKFPDDRKGAMLAASEVAYEYFVQGLHKLQGSGAVARPSLHENKSSRKWLLTRLDASELQVDTHSHDRERPHGETQESERNEATDMPLSEDEHYNFLCDRVKFRCSTPATVSFYAQIVSHRKRLSSTWSHKGVVLSQAYKYVDPVTYDGPKELLELEGTAFQDSTTGYVLKLNTFDGWFGSQIDGETDVRDLETIVEGSYALNHRNFQRPYFVDPLDSDDLVINDPIPDFPKGPSSVRYPSKLRQVQMAEDIDEFLQAEQQSNEQHAAEVAHDANGDDMEEYSPHNALISSTRLDDEEWQLEEMTEAEINQQVDALFARAIQRHHDSTKSDGIFDHLGFDESGLSSDSTLAERDTSDDEDSASSGATTPEYEPISSCGHLSSLATAATASPPCDDTQDMVAILDTFPTPPAKLASTSPTIAQAAGGSLSQYAGTYAAFVVGFGIAASIFW